MITVRTERNEYSDGRLLQQLTVVRFLGIVIYKKIITPMFPVKD